MMKSLLVLLAVIANIASGRGDIILKPLATAKGPVASLVIIHGAMIDPSAYVPLAEAIQAATPLQLWVGLPVVDLNIPGSIAKSIDKIIQEMKNDGMVTSYYFYSGHSLGTIKIQAYCYDYATNCTGQILFAGNLLRNGTGYQYDRGYPTPTLTVGGELDGLTRVTRMMEGYNKQVLNAPTSKSGSRDFPVVVFKGVTHMLFASGTPPPLVFEKDLKPEVSFDQAHTMIGQAVGSWLGYRVSNINPTYLDSALKQTDQLLAPINQAFEMESYYFFEIPCYLKYPAAVDGDDCCHQGGGCQCGNMWTQTVSQQFMGGLDQITVADYDTMHPVSQIPIHLAHIYNTCDKPDSTCVLQTNTVSENIYGDHINSDNPFYPLAATEIRTKLKSRQTIQLAAGVPNVDFNEADGPSRCAQLNQYTFDWALHNAGTDTQKRYLSLGQRLVFGDDHMESSGYTWITTPMKYTPTVIDGQQVILINSTALATPADFWQKDSRGMHYCKVLSPAYATEWIYVDGLRLNDSLSSKS